MRIPEADFEDSNYEIMHRSKSTGNLDVKRPTFETKKAELLSYNDALEQYRNNAKKSTDPIIQLSFVKYLVEASQVADETVNGDSKMSPKKALQSEAVKWLKRLSSNGIGLGKQPLPEAQFYLAECYGKGSLGLGIDVDKAFVLYVQASKQNHIEATYRCAYCYEYGIGTKKDSSRAVQFYRKASSLGEPLSMHRLAIILLHGLLNQTKNPKEGMTWLKRAASMANENHPEALHDLALCFEKNGCSAVIPDENYALDLYKRAANYAYPPSQFKLGYCYEFGMLGCPIDPPTSIYYYQMAASKGDSDAELALSGWHLTGADKILAQSDVEAYVWARKSADKKNPKAEFAIGHYSEKGIGVRADLEEAKRWYARAAAQGNKRALARLSELKKSSKENLSKLDKDGKEKSLSKSPSDCIIS